jgi:hypothetical protein
VMRRAMIVLCGIAVWLAAAPAASAADSSPCLEPYDEPNGNGRVQKCPVWMPARGYIPVHDVRGGQPVEIGRFHFAGTAYWFVCQDTTPGGITPAAYRDPDHPNIWNRWWALTRLDDGRWGWVNEMYFAGGGNDEPDGAFKYCDTGSATPPGGTPSPPAPPTQPLNGRNATASARLVIRFARDDERRTVAFGGRAIVRVRLRSENGTPIAGARLQLYGRTLTAGAPLKMRRQLVTDANGRASFRAERGPSRVFQAQYRFRSGDVRPTVTANAQLDVRARISLRISPDHLATGDTMHMRGRLAAAPGHRLGKIIVLQAFERGHWRLFQQARARRDGRFHSRWRILGGARRSYLIRAVAPADPSYPYATGRSRSVRVTVG